MKIDVTTELIFKTARSGGKGGQNVNKVETMVEARWHIAGSKLVSDEQKQLLITKLANKITADGHLLAKSQEARTQIDNKAIATYKINEWIHNALKKKKIRIATKVPRAVTAKRIDIKKRMSENKQNRKKIKPHDL